jgi:nucleotide sugar dehydrogenase
MHITVVGGGRMGLPLACVLARHGAHVTVADIDAALVARINAGDCPYEEPGLAELMAELRVERRLDATTDTTAATGRSEAVIVIVPAHLTPEREIDFRVLEAASRDVGRGLKPGTLVVYETTVSIGGTRRRLIPVLEQVSGLRAGKDFSVAYSPERVKANLVLERLSTTPKVVGGLDDASREKVTHLYGTYLQAPVDDVGTLEAAESTKLLGMLYRDVNIALANELAAFCELAGVDFDRVRAAANTDGEANLLIPGIGVGGHCTPVYPYFLTRESRRLGFTQRISEAAREINDYQPARQLDRVARYWKPLKGQRVHILGLGFRPGVKVDTFSPAYPLRDHLVARGAVVTIEDPYYSQEELRHAGFEPGVVNGAGLVVLNTAHTEFAAPPFDAWHQAGVEAVLDGRNLWRQTEAEQAGLLYFGIGRASRLEREHVDGGSS